MTKKDESKPETTLEESWPEQLTEESKIETTKESEVESKDRSKIESDAESNEESTSAMDPVERIRRLLEKGLGLTVSSETVDHGSRRVNNN